MSYITSNTSVVLQKLSCKMHTCGTDSTSTSLRPLHIHPRPSSSISIRLLFFTLRFLLVGLVSSKRSSSSSLYISKKEHFTYKSSVKDGVRFVGEKCLVHIQSQDKMIQILLIKMVTI